VPCTPTSYVDSKMLIASLCNNVTHYNQCAFAKHWPRCGARAVCDSREAFEQTAVIVWHSTTDRAPLAAVTLHDRYAYELSPSLLPSKAFQPSSIRFQLHLTLDFAPICVSVGIGYVLYPLVWAGYHKEEWTPNRTRRPSPHQQRGSVSTRLSFEHEMQRVSKLVHPPTGTHTHTHSAPAFSILPSPHTLPPHTRTQRTQVSKTGPPRSPCTPKRLRSSTKTSSTRR
jgi:hypothetical protein